MVTNAPIGCSGHERELRMGIGLPAAVPGVDATAIGAWAAEAERAGLASVGVIDRLVYDNLEPLTVLAAAARTEHVELFTTVLNVGSRGNPVLLAKQMASVERLSGGRLTAGLGLGGWPEDFAASQVPTSGIGARLCDTLATMRRVWAGELSGQGGPMPRLPEGRHGDAGFDMARADTLTSPDQIHHELDYLAKRGVTDLVLYPSSTDPDQIQLLVEALGPWPPERRSA
jgi:alkanesulfonate monooxygenase SsuD/methylene tetrahydromethanopterin reductase-like flavin-dependent oxidoreductase (luciferase family)